MSMINAQQLIVLMPLFMVALPANAGMFFAQLMSIAAFDYFEIGPFLDEWLNLKPTDPVNGNFEAVGFESVYFLHNLGTLVLAFVVYFTAVLYSWICRHLCCDIVTYHGENLQRKLKYGSLLSILTESYSIVAVSCLINLQRLSWTSYGTIVQSSATLIFLAVLVGFPLVYGNYLLRKFDQLAHANVRERHGAFYDELSLRNGKMVLLQPVWFLVRRLLLAIIVVLLKTTVIWQISLMTLTVITQVIILGRVGPFVEKSKIRFEFFSEVTLMLVMYHMICFTPFVPDVQVRFNLGYSVCAVISFHLLLSFGLLAKRNHGELKIGYIKWKGKREYTASRKALKKFWKERKVIRQEARKQKREEMKRKMESRGLPRYEESEEEEPESSQSSASLSVIEEAKEGQESSSSSFRSATISEIERTIIGIKEVQQEQAKEQESSGSSFRSATISEIERTIIGIKEVQQEQAKEQESSGSSFRSATISEIERTIVGLQEIRRDQAKEQEQSELQISEEQNVSHVRSETSLLVISQSEESKADSSFMDIQGGSQSEIDRKIRLTIGQLQNVQLAEKRQPEEKTLSLPGPQVTLDESIEEITQIKTLSEREREFDLEMAASQTKVSNLVPPPAPLPKFKGATKKRHLALKKAT